MSGRLHASGAGDRSSVLVSPVTLKTVTVILEATSGRVVNHSALDQLSMTSDANLLPAVAFSATSWKKSNISSVFFNAAAATAATSESSRSISGLTL